MRSRAWGFWRVRYYWPSPNRCIQPILTRNGYVIRCIKTSHSRWFCRNHGGAK